MSANLCAVFVCLRHLVKKIFASLILGAHFLACDTGSIDKL
jgi:hypothetical protein